MQGIYIAVLIALVLYVSWSLLKKQARDMVVKPWKTDKDRPAALGSGVKSFEMPFTPVSGPSGKVYIYMFFPSEMTCKDKLVYFLPGSSYNVGFYQAQCRALADSLGTTVCTLEYPGFGSSTGTPSRENINLASLHALSYACSSMNIPTKNVMIYGFSLGTHVAAWLSTIVDSRYIVLDACVPVIADAAVKDVHPSFIRPLVKMFLSGYYDIRQDLASLSNAKEKKHVVGIFRTYDHLVSYGEFQKDVAPYCTNVVHITAGHAWPIVSPYTLRRIALGFQVQDHS